MTPQHLGDVPRQRTNFDYAEGNRDDAGETERERNILLPCDFPAMSLLWRVVILNRPPGRCAGQNFHVTPIRGPLTVRLSNSAVLPLNS
jgi:hypothetical protein